MRDGLILISVIHRMDDNISNISLYKLVDKVPMYQRRFAVDDCSREDKWRRVAQETKGIRFGR